MTVERGTDKKLVADVVEADFLGLMRELRKGNAAFEISEGMDRVVAGIKKSGKAGKVKVTLTISPASVDVDGNVTECYVEDSVKFDVPEKNKGKTIFYTTKTNRLTRVDPNQTEMDLKA